MDPRELIIELRKLVEKRLELQLSPFTALRLEHRLFKALHGQSNVFRIAETGKRMREAKSPWDK